MSCSASACSMGTESMFTGIVEAVGTIRALKPQGRGARIAVAVPSSFNLKARVALGDSIAVNGCCVTATALDGSEFAADVSAETVALTCFKFYRPGHKVNLELACTPSTHLGGHIVQGHVDGVAEIKSVARLDAALDLWCRAPAALARYIAMKGSIAVDGVSLTVNEVKGSDFRLTIIPHTQQTMALSNWQAGARVNLEVDVLSRYLERLLECGAVKPASSGTLTRSTLLENGFF